MSDTDNISRIVNKFDLNLKIHEDRLKDSDSYKVTESIGKVDGVSVVLRHKDEALEETSPRYGYLGIVEADIKKKYTKTSKITFENINVVNIKEGKKQ